MSCSATCAWSSRSTARTFHSDPEVFDADRRRQNLLVLHGWRVLRITWTMMQLEPDQVITMVREAMAMSAVA